MAEGYTEDVMNQKLKLVYLIRIFVLVSTQNCATVSVQK